MGLLPLDQLPVSGFGGQVFLLPTYLVELCIRDQTPNLIEVIAHSTEPYVLLGRDVLNHYRLVFDGPQQTLAIE